MGIWDAFDKEINSEEMQKSIDNAAKNTGSGYREVPEGEYVVTFDKVLPAESKNGMPIIKIQARIQEGSYKKSCLFQTLALKSARGANATAFCLKNACDWLNSLEVEDEGGDLIKVTPKTISHAKLLDIAEAVDLMQLSYKIGYHDDNGFKRITILEVLD